MAVLGMRGHVMRLLLKEDISMFYSGPESTVALGMSGHVVGLLTEDISRCCSGLGRMAVLGIRGHVAELLSKDI